MKIFSGITFSALLLAFFSVVVLGGARSEASARWFNILSSKCQTALDLNEAPVSHAKQTEIKQALSNSVHEMYLKRAHIKAVNPRGAKAKHKVYLVESSNYTWWVVETQTSSGAKFDSGQLGANDAQLFKLAGATLNDSETGDRYQFDRAIGRYRHFSQENLEAYKAFVENILNNDDEVAKQFLKRYGQFILNNVQDRTFKFEALSEGRFVSATRSKRLKNREEMNDFYLFLPSDISNKAFLFTTAPGYSEFSFYNNFERQQVYVLKRGDKNLYSNVDPHFITYDFADRSPQILSKNVEPFILSNHQIAFSNFHGQYGNSIFVIDASGLRQVRQRLIEIDQAQDHYEGGPYLDFADKYLATLIEFGLLQPLGIRDPSFDYVWQRQRYPFRYIEKLEILGEGYSSRNPKKTFTYFRIGDEFLYATSVSGEPKVDLVPWSMPKNQPNAEKNARPFFKRADWFTRQFGSMVILPNQKVVTLGSNGLLKPRVYSVTDSVTSEKKSTLPPSED